MGTCRSPFLRLKGVRRFEREWLDGDFALRPQCPCTAKVSLFNQVLLSLSVDGKAGFKVVAMEDCRSMLTSVTYAIGEEYPSRGKAKLEMTRNGRRGVEAWSFAYVHH